MGWIVDHAVAIAIVIALTILGWRFLLSFLFKRAGRDNPDEARKLEEEYRKRKLY